MMRKFFEHEKGQGLAEYAAILLIIAVFVFGAYVILGPRIRDVFGSVYNSLR